MLLEAILWAIQNDAKELKTLLKPWHMGTHLRELSEGYPAKVYANMLRFRCFSKIFVLVLFTKEASALEGLSDAF